MKSEINEIAVEFIVYGLLPSIYSWLFVTIPLHRLIVPRLFSLPTIPLFRFAWSRKEKNHDATSGISLFSSTCIFAGCKKKKKKKERRKTGGKRADDFSRLSVKRWRDHRDDYWALLGPGCDRTSEWVMLYCLRRPCGVSDRPSAPLNSTCLSMLCAAYLRLMAKVTSPFPSLLRDSLGQISRKPLFSHDKGETRSPAGFFLFSDFLPRGSRPPLRRLYY